MNQKALSQVQSVSIVAIIIIALVIAGSAYYISTAPTELTTVTETATATTTTTVGGGTTTVTQTTTQTVIQTTTVTETPAPVRVGMILSTSGSISFWDQSGVNGLQSAQERYGIEFEFVEWTTHEENERALRSMADRGFDIILDHDTIMQDTVAKVAPDYPDTWFGTPYGQPEEGYITGPSLGQSLFRAAEILGHGYAGSRGYYYNGNIAIVKVYNKTLSDNAIKQNYNALKGRFGL